MRRVLTAVAGAATLFLPIANAVAAGIQKAKPKHKTATKHAKATKPKKHAVTVTKTVTGDLGSAGQWGEVQVTLVVKKTTTTVGKKKHVKRTVTGLKVPVFPDHTDRSVFINQQAIPMLEQEELQAHYTTNIYMIGGATYTSQGFLQSLQSALLKVQNA